MAEVAGQREGHGMAKASPRAEQTARLAWSALAVAAAYYAGSLAGFACRFPGSPISVLWPPNAVLLAALLLSPARRWWLFLLAAFPAHVAAQAQGGAPAGVLLSRYAFNCAVVLVSAAAIRRFAGAPFGLNSFRQAATFIAFAVLAPALASPLSPSVLVALWRGGDWATPWRDVFLSNVLAFLVLTPAIVTLVAGGLRRARNASPQRLGEFCLLAALLVVVTTAVFGGETAAGSGDLPALVYAPLPLLLWAAVRFGPSTLSLSLLALAALSITLAVGGDGPFRSLSPAENVLSLQLFLIEASLPLLLLAGLVEERRGVEARLRESQQRYRRATTAGGVGVWDWDLESGVIYVDPMLKSALGFADHEIGNHIDDWGRRVHPDDAERVMAAARAHMDGKTPCYEIEHRMLARDGSVRWFLARGEAVEHVDGRARRMVGTDTDITQRKRAEEEREDALAALRENEERSRTLLRDLQVGVLLQGCQAEILLCNPAALEMLGLTREQLIGKTSFDPDWNVIHEDGTDFPGECHPVPTAIATGRPVRGVVMGVYRPSTRDRVWLLVDAIPQFAEGGATPRHVICTFTDITARRQAELDLLREKHFSETALCSLPGIFYLFDESGRFLRWNENFERVSGYGPEEIARMHPLDFFRGADKAVIAERIGEVFAAGASAAEADFVSRDGRATPFYLTGRRLERDGTPCVVGMGLDITERKQAEQEKARLASLVAREHERLENLVSSVPGVVWEVRGEPDGAAQELVYVSGHAEAMLGYTTREWLSAPDLWLTLVHPEDHERAAREGAAIFARGAAGSHRFRWVARDGRVLPAEAHIKVIRDPAGHPAGMCGVTLDVSEREAAYEALRQRDQLLQAMFHSLSSHVVVLDRAGTITYASRSWDRFAEANAAVTGGFGVGSNYLEVCRRATAEGDADARRAVDAIEAVLSGRMPHAELEYPCHSPTEERWFLMHVDPMPPEHGGAIVSHTDVTERIRAQAEREAALAAQWQSENRFRRLAESGMIGIIVGTADGELVEVNDSFLGMVGYTRGDFEAGRVRWGEMTPPEFAPRDERASEMLRSRRACPPYEKEYVRKDGSRVPVLIGGAAVEGRPRMAICFVLDLTERRRAEDALRRSEARSRAIRDALPDVVFLQSRDGVYLDYHAKDPAALLVPPEQFLGRNMREVLPPALAEGLSRCFARVERSDAVAVLEYRLPIAGKERHFEARVVRCDPDTVLSVVRDITDHKRAEGEREAALVALRRNEAALRRSAARIQNLAGRLITAQEEERRRISRELHDDLNQKLAALAIALSNLMNRLPEGADDVRDELNRLQQRTVALTDDVRHLSHELHSAVLEHAGLEPALRAFCDEFCGYAGMPVRVHIDGGAADDAPRDVALCLYRVTQEALANIARHARASEARVDLRRSRAGFHLGIADDGLGFDVEEAPRQGGLGLVSMRERVRLLQGRLQMRAKPGQGTQLRVFLPLRKEQEAP